MSFLVSGMGVVGCNQSRLSLNKKKMEGTTKLEGTSNDALWFGHCLTNELGFG